MDWTVWRTEKLIQDAFYNKDWGWVRFWTGVRRDLLRSKT